MQNYNRIVLLSLSIFIFSCNGNNKINTVEQWKNEIIKTEHDFAQMVRNEGIGKAFLKYSDEDAVLMRGKNLVIGKKAIGEFYKDQMTVLRGESLTWEPDFVSISKAGDLGYTYGYYTYSYLDSSGNQKESQGVFHTVWKKQEDGNWRFVWD